MPASSYFNRVQFVAGSAGTGAFVVATPQVGFRTPAQAGIVDGTLVSYTAINPINNNPAEWETGQGTYHVASTSITRDTVRESSAGNVVVNFSSAPLVFLDVQAQDFAAFGGVVTPGGATKAVQFNNAGNFGGNTQLTYDFTNTFFGIGTNAVPLATFHSANDASISDSFLFECFNSGSPPLMRLFNHRGAQGTKGTLLTNDAYGTILFNGADGSFEITGASIAAAGDGTIGSLSMPGRLMFFTTPAASFTPAERMRINNAGMVGINTTGLTFAGFNVQFTTATDTNANWLSRFASFGNNSFSIVNLYTKTRGATPDTQGALIQGDAMLEFRVMASDGTSFIKSGSINFDVGGTVALGVVPTTISFFNMDGNGLNQNRLFVSVAGQTQLINFDSTAANINRTVQARRLGSGLVVGNGVGYSFAVQTPSSGVIEGCAIDSVLTNVGVGTEAFDLAFKTYGSGALSERARFDSAGRLLVGTTTPINTQGPGVAPFYQVHGLGVSAQSQWSVTRWQNAATSPGMSMSKSRGTTVGAFAIVSSGDQLGQLKWYGDDGTQFVLGAQIQSLVDGTPAVNVMPSRLQFHTTNTAGTLNEVLRINQIGLLWLGYNGAPVAPFLVQGSDVAFVQVATNAPWGWGQITYGNNAGVSGVIFAKSRNATPGVQTIVANGDRLAEFEFLGSDGVDYQFGAHIKCLVDGNPAAGSMPARLEFGTTAAGTTTAIPRLRIDNAGDLHHFGASLNAASLDIRTLTELTTIAAAASTNTAIQIPANAVVFGVSVRVVTVIPTAATFTVTGGATTFDTAPVSTAANSTDPGTAAGPKYFAAATAITITPNLTPAAATGQVRVTIHFYTVTPPTS